MPRASTRFSSFLFMFLSLEYSTRIGFAIRRKLHNNHPKVITRQFSVADQIVEQILRETEQVQKSSAMFADRLVARGMTDQLLIWARSCQPIETRRKWYHSGMIEWTTALSTGVPVLDEHHRTIFRWLAELESAAAEQRTLFGVYVITRLKHYVREHFAAEEALMKSAGYPDLVQHMAEHEAFRAKIGELQLRSIARDVSAETVEFLKEWLANHIAKTDMAYVPYLNKPEA